MTDLWVERTGVRRYTGHSSRGAEVLVGSEDVDGVFTPGELMKIALAACSGMSSDQPLARRLGDDYQATVRVSGAADRDQERYPLLEETLEVDLSSLSEEEAQRMVAEKAIASVDLTVALATGKLGHSAESVTRSTLRYVRKRVRANRRRLARGR